MGRQMRLFVTGGSKFDPAIGRDLYSLGFTILQAYGLTETSGAGTINTPRRSAHRHRGPAAAGHRDQDPAARRRRRRRRRRRNRHSRPDRDAGLLQPSRRHRRGDAGRLVPDRRPGPHGRRRPPDDHRPQEGNDRPRVREEHLSGGDRGALPEVAVREGDLRDDGGDRRQARRRAALRRGGARTWTSCASGRSSTPATCCASRWKGWAPACRRTSACWATRSGSSRCRAPPPES